MADEGPPPDEKPAPIPDAAGGAAPYWRYTLWAMFGIQFVHTMANSVLTPIMPLFLPELGVTSESAIDLWAGILSGVTSFVAAFASPLWGSLADRHGRKLMLLRSSFAIALFTALMGVAGNVWQFFAFRALMGVFAGFSSAAIALVASQVPEGRLGYSLGLALDRPARRLADRPDHRRHPGRHDRQLPHPVLHHLGDDLPVDGAGVVHRPRGFRASAEEAAAAARP